MNDSECLGFEEHIDGLVLLFTQCFGLLPFVFDKIMRILFESFLTGLAILQKTLEINTQSLDQLRAILFKDVNTIRISDTFEKPEMATDFMEHDLDKLNILRQRGRESFAPREHEIRSFLI